MPYRQTSLLIYNLIFLSLICMFFAFKSIQEGNYANFIFWPGAYFVAMAIMSSFLIQQVPKRIKAIHSLDGVRLIIQSLVFGFLFYLLTDLIILILERFFRLEEHYTIVKLVDRWQSHWYLVFEGVFVFFLYQIIIRYDYQRHNINRNQKIISDLEVNITSSNLESLKTELNPHFLYNAMNSISMMIRVKEYSKSINMIANLNELLRVVLNKSNDQFVILSDELELLDKYLKIEILRFGDRVVIKQEIDESTLQAIVPQLILQPIVENAFKHGMHDDLGKQQILIKSSKVSDKLLMSVFNTTQSNLPMDFSNKESHGIGLKNVMQRLRQLYGNSFQLQLEQHSDGIEFRIIIPFKV